MHGLGRLYDTGDGVFYGRGSGGGGIFAPNLAGLGADAGSAISSGITAAQQQAIKEREAQQRAEQAAKEAAAKKSGAGGGGGSYAVPATTTTPVAPIPYSAPSEGFGKWLPLAGGAAAAVAIVWYIKKRKKS